MLMKNKATLLLHSFDGLISHLNDEEAGMLLKAILDYDIRGERTDFEDRALLFLYCQITDSLDVHRKNYEKVCEARKNSIKKRWEKSKDKQEKDESVQMYTNEYNINENIKQNEKENINENLNLNVNVNEKENKAEGVESTDTQTHKKACGDFSNVFLTDEEYRLVREKIPDGEKKLQSLSAYIASTGKTYANHYARLLSWSLYDDSTAKGDQLMTGYKVKNQKSPGERREPNFDVSEFKKKALNLKFVPPPEDDRV